MVSDCPKKLFIIHRVHIDSAFFAGDQNVFHILLNRNQRARFNVVISMVFYQMLDCLTSERTKLNFVKDYDRLALYQIYMILKLELKE